jgi:hypothetical protein
MVDDSHNSEVRDEKKTYSIKKGCPMKKFFFSLAFFSFMAQAEVHSLYVSNLNFDYVNPQGRGSADTFGSSLNEGARLDLLVDRVDRDFRLTIQGNREEMFEFKNAPDFMVDAETMSVNQFNLNWADRLNLSLSSGRFDSREDGLKLDGLSLDCIRAEEESNVLDQLVQGCVQNLSFKLSKFTSSGNYIFFEELSDSRGGDLQVNSLDFKIRSRKFDLTADVRAQVSGKVKASGQISYDSQRGQLTIKISEVKFGFLNITSKVFDELKKNQNDRMTVKEPYIYYLLK